MLVEQLQLSRFTWSFCVFFFFSSRRRHTRCLSDWSSDVSSSDLVCRLLLEKIIAHAWTPDTSASRISSSPWHLPFTSSNYIAIYITNAYSSTQYTTCQLPRSEQA